MDEGFLKFEKNKQFTVMTVVLDSILVDENEKLKNAFTALLGEGAKNIILDLSNTVYVSSLVLASLVFMDKKAQEAGGSLVICGVNNRIKEILTVTNLDKIFIITADKQEAIDKITKK